MESTKLQKFYSKTYFEKNNNKTNLVLRKNFKEDTVIELDLNNNILGRIKCSLFGSYKGKEFFEICKIISEKNEKIITKFIDVRYHINLKNKENNELELREEK